MRVLVTGSAGHLGEALVRTLHNIGEDVVGLDLCPSPFTDRVGSITNPNVVRECVADADVILHTATLHKPHIATHSRQDFIDTNITGTLNLLEAAVSSNCQSFIFTSTTSVFGDAMQPVSAGSAVWVTEKLMPAPKNIYGVSKTAAEDLCKIFNRNTGLPCVILRTSRFFPEIDDDPDKRDAYEDTNLKVNELLFRRVDVEDVVTAHQLAVSKASEIGFDRFIISATTPFQPSDVEALNHDAPSVVERCVPIFNNEYQRRGWTMFPKIGRVYDNTHARQALGWSPKYSFGHAIELLAENKDYRSAITEQIGSKG